MVFKQLSKDNKWNISYKNTMEKKLFANIAINYHIMEIRLRIIYLILSFVITFLVCYYYSLELIYLFVKPLLKYQNTFMFTDLTEALYTTINHCLFTTIFVMLPFICYQIWCFLIPSSFLCERKKITSFCFSIIVLFFLGVGISYFLLLPEVYSFLLHFEIKNDLIILQLQPRIQSYIYLVWKFFILVGIFSQIPIIFFLFFQLKLLTAKYLSENRHFILIFCLILAALLSPPDIFSELSVAFFLLCNLEIIIWLGFIHSSCIRILNIIDD